MECANKVWEFWEFWEFWEKWEFWEFWNHKRAQKGTKKRSVWGRNASPELSEILLP